ncbi:MAG: hypothetical protein ABMA00_11235 [Gemmatimonas sp.]
MRRVVAGALCASALLAGGSLHAQQTTTTTRIPPSRPPATAPVKAPVRKVSAPVARDTATTRKAVAPAAVVAPAVAAPAVAAKIAVDPRYRWARVTYLSGELVYIDAGSVAGLREKSVVDVMRRDSVVAVLEVQFVSSSSASGKITRGSGVVIGDSARFTPTVDAVVVASSATPRTDSVTAAATRVADARKKGPRTVQGRVGLRYMSLQTGAGASGRLTQPAIDLRLEGHRMDGSPLGILIDARAHRQTTGSGRIDGSTRVYQSLVEYQGGGQFPVRVTAGRQLSSVLSPLGFFDGLTLDIDRKHWRVGALGGTQPDFLNFRPSGAIKEAGAWLQWHNAPNSGSMFQTTLGGVGSYTADGVNREFALLSTIYVSPVVSLYATHELDVNRGWKKTAEAGKALTPTSTFATLRVALNRSLSVNGGYDSRRSVRLYRDFLTPDVAFDDALRKGYWGGVSMSIPHVYASADMRTSDGETVGRSQSNTAMLSVTRLTPLGIGMRARATNYTGPTVTGTLTSGSVEVNPFGRIRIEATAGRRDDQRASEGMVPVRTTWVGFDADAGIGRQWYVMLSTYREVGATDRLLQQYVSLSWRF